MAWELRYARWLLLGAFVLTFPDRGQGSAQSAPAGSQPSSAERVQIAAQSLASAYDPATGLFQGTGWWNSANGITALANAARVLPTSSFDGIFRTTFRVAQDHAPGFLNEFYDDEGWWALAWLDVYRLRPDPRYRIMAESIFADMAGGWSDTCGGGIWWKKNVRYKNAIANELFLSVAVGLAATHEGRSRARYLQWATKEWRWFRASGMINQDWLINDGLDASCRNNGKTTWSYNQGVILGGLTGLYQLSHEPGDLAEAKRIAVAASEHLTDANGVLHDPCEPQCGADGVQFKGIFVRNLAPLLRISPSPQLSRLVVRNAESIWTNARTGSNRFSVNWAGPPQEGDTGSLISALDALTADLAIQQHGANPQAH